jgi:hypothetical protein
MTDKPIAPTYTSVEDVENLEQYCEGEFHPIHIGDQLHETRITVHSPYHIVGEFPGAHLSSGIAFVNNMLEVLQTPSFFLHFVRSHFRSLVSINFLLAFPILK